MPHDPATYDHSTYLSPFTWRYGTQAMRALFSLQQQRVQWRTVWAALAQAQADAGLIPQEQADDISAHVQAVDIAASLALEAEVRHDLVAELRVFAAQCHVGGGVIHLGATSADIEDNADVLRLRAALGLLVERLRAALDALAALVEQHAHTACMGATHLQPAEPTTLGYRLAPIALAWHDDLHALAAMQRGLRGKGVKGAVGTSAAYAQLLEGTGVSPRAFEASVMARLGLPAFEATGQTYPRRQDWLVLNALATVALSAHKLAFDLRLLQMPSVGELAEPFGARQVGSSAMPFKRNPIDAENINSLARLVAGLPRILWDDGALSLLERTLDDSANRRSALPEAFLATDEILARAARVLRGLRVDEAALARNLDRWGVFAATERVLMAATRAGADRQALHELIRQHSLAAWAQVEAGQPNPLVALLAADAEVTRWLAPGAVHALMDARAHLGDAAERALAVAAQVRATAT